MLTVQVERLAAGLDELKPILPRHYEELSLHQFHGIPLNPNYPFYLAKEEAGECIYVTLREAGRLVGYFVGFVSPGLHYQDCLTLIGDIFYVVPEHRGSAGGVLLFGRVKEEARRRGVKAFWAGDKVHAAVHADRLFEKMGFELAEKMYCLWIEED